MDDNFELDRDEILKVFEAKQKDAVEQFARMIGIYYFYEIITPVESRSIYQMLEDRLGDLWWPGKINRWIELGRITKREGAAFLSHRRKMLKHAKQIVKAYFGDLCEKPLNKLSRELWSKINAILESDKWEQDNVFHFYKKRKKIVAA